jgi:hypothetical protein
MACNRFVLEGTLWRFRLAKALVACGNGRGGDLGRAFLVQMLVNMYMDIVQCWYMSMGTWISMEPDQI